MNEPTIVPEQALEFSLSLISFLEVLTEGELSQVHSLCTFQLGAIREAINEGRTEFKGIDLAKRTEIVHRVRHEIAREYEKRIKATVKPAEA